MNSRRGVGRIRFRFCHAVVASQRGAPVCIRRTRCSLLIAQFAARATVAHPLIRALAVSLRGGALQLALVASEVLRSCFGEARQAEQPTERFSQAHEDLGFDKRCSRYFR